VVAAAGEVIPADGEVIEGAASVDESTITGESAPVIREAGGDRNSVTGGTKVLSDRLVIRVTANPGESFLDHMIHLVEGARRVTIFGESVAVRADIHTLGGLSAHADQEGLLGWLGHFRRPPRQTFIVHGEADTARIFAGVAAQRLGWQNVVVPQHGGSVEVI
jgi:Cft2 family RNA processing exonuclease